MTSVIIDRRPQTGKSVANRQRVLRRLNKMLKQQVDQLVSQRKIGDMGQSAEVTVEKTDVSEPRFAINQESGNSDRVLPGNQRYRVGDWLQKPPENDMDEGGSGDGEDGTDSFRFILAREEFLSLLFDDLELPELLKKELLDVVDKKYRRGGIVHQGIPSTLSVARTFRAALGRRIAAAGAAAEDLSLTEFYQDVAQDTGNKELALAMALQAQEVSHRARNVPFIDPVDLRHRSLVEFAAPRTAAVMFCLMDVSGSMDEDRKDLAKRFFTLLYLFLTRKYAKVELVFIRHTESAQEVDEETFFHSPQTGGTRVLSALELMKDIIDKRFPPNRYNIFGAQASDGDAFGSDVPASLSFLTNELLPLTRYFVYAETNESPDTSTSLWTAYHTITAENFSKAPIATRQDVYPALVRLFAKEKK